MRCFFPVLCALLLTCCRAAPSLPEPATERYEAERAAMGTRFRLVVYAETAEQAERAQNASWARLEELEACMSDYRPQSELSLLSHSGGEWRACSPDLWRVLTAAADMNRSSAGAFDITVGPLVKLWRRAMRQERLPTEQDLQQARCLVGAQRLQLDPSTHSARLQPAGVRLDLGGIAKGDALDEILLVLREHGIESALVDGGGDVLLGAAPPGKRGWAVALANGAHSLVLEKCAIATSGSDFQFIELDGVRYSHIVDPRSGYGVVDAAQVSVIARNARTADAAATAFSVLGQRAGMTWIEQRADLEGCRWQTQNPEARPCTSSGFGL